MYIVGEAESLWNDYDEDGAVVYWRKKEWTMLQCPVCENVSLHTEYHSFDSLLDIEFVYPKYTFDDFFSNDRSEHYCVPEIIQKSFVSALKSQYNYIQLCLIMMRKTIELICRDQGVYGNSLEQLLESLSRSEKCPGYYCDICQIIRYYGNIAAHVYTKDYILNSNYVNRLLVLLYRLIEYVYIIPAQITKLTPNKTHKYK